MPFTVLAVCMGNVCRSPMVERLLRMHLNTSDPASGFDVSSAGVRALVGAPIHPWVRRDLESLGADGDDFAARQLHSSMVEQADLVLTATAAVRGRLLEEVPTALRRTFTVLDFAALSSSPAPEPDPRALVRHASASRSSLRLDHHDVPDPINGSPELFAAVTDRLDEATRTIAGALLSTSR